jgi:hypothetical protein
MWYFRHRLNTPGQVKSTTVTTQNLRRQMSVYLVLRHISTYLCYVVTYWNYLPIF